MALVRLHVRYRPAWLDGGDRVVVRLDGKVIHDGPASAGIDRVADLEMMGEHLLETALHVRPGVVRTRRYRVDLTAPGYERGGVSLFVARLRFSRVWGNFTSRLRLDLAEWRCARAA